MTGLFDLEGKVAIVTGASSGLGRHFATTLARAGAKVALAARREDALADTAREIEAFDGRALAIHLDVSDAESVRTCVAEAQTELGPISILINNAGIAVNKPLLEQAEDDWDRVLDTNLKGAWLMAQEVARHMVRLGRGGTIVNIASVLAFAARPGVVSYCASKAGLTHLTKALAVELARHDIRVNALAPGYFETEINRDFRASAAGDDLLRSIPQRRYGTGEDLDGVLLLLASEASRYMTGSVLVVDGGITSRL